MFHVIKKTSRVVLLLTVCVLTLGPVGFAAPSTGSGQAEVKRSIPDALTVIHQRKSVRNYTGEAVDVATLEELVRAGMAAPTAVNMQPWEFVIVSSPEKMKELADALPYGKMLKKAGGAIVVCALPKKAFQEKAEFAILDATCATENILLAVEALGLGGVWVSTYPEPERMDAARRALGIPEDVIPLNVVAVGHPVGTERPKDKFKPEKIHWEKW